MFYMYVYNGMYIRISSKTLKASTTDDIEKAAYWTDKRNAKSWGSAIKSKYPEAELKEAILTIKH